MERGGEENSASAPTHFVLLAVGIYFLTKALDRLLRPRGSGSTGSSSPEPRLLGMYALREKQAQQHLLRRPPRWSAWRSALGSAATPAVIAVVVAWVYFGTPVPWKPSPTSPFDSVPSDQWFNGPNATRYQLHIYGDGSQMRAPVLDCAHYPLAEFVAAVVLPPVEELARTDARDPGVRNKQLEQRQAIEQIRAVAAAQCLLDMPQLFVPDHLQVTEFLERVGPAAWRAAARLTNAAQLSDARVRDVLIGRDGERFLRVLAVSAVSNGTSGGGGSRKAELRAAIITEASLLDAASMWQERILTRAKTHIEHYPCLCAAHFGIVGSGLHLHYEEAEGTGTMIMSGPDGIRVIDDEATKRAMRRRQWHLWSETALAHENVLSDYVSNTIEYLDFLSPFPGNVHALLNLSTVEHYSLNTVEYLELTELLDRTGGHTRIDGFSPFWLLPPDEIVDATNTTVGLAGGQPQLMAVLGIRKLAGGRMTRRELRGPPNVCFVYCRRAEERLAKELA